MLKFTQGAFIYYVITFSQIFEPTSSLCNQVWSLSKPPPSYHYVNIVKQSPPPPLCLPLTKCIVAVFQKTDFCGNSKKYKTKTIPKNRILFKPKYDFKNKDAALWKCFQFVLLFCWMYSPWARSNKKSV